MDFRDVEHGNRVFASGVDFSTPRVIASAAQIPSIGPFGFDKSPKPVRLRGVTSAASRDLVSARGAFQEYGQWVVPRIDPFPFDLQDHLPRMAWRSVTPEITDMIPKVSWSWSLARMMVQDDWNALVGEIIAAQRVCYECGGVPVPVRDPKASWATDPATRRLDGHEVWSFNGTEPTGFSNDGYAIPGVQRLVSILPLCGRCHETKHLGNARNRDPRIFERAFARLGAINRVSFADYPDGEAAAYRLEIDRKYQTRNKARRYWAMDFAALAGRELRMRSSIGYAGENMIARSAKGGGEPSLLRVLNADFLQRGAHLVIRPRGWGSAA